MNRGRGKANVMKAVSVQGLIKDYPRIRAVNEISFEVEQGEIFGVVGPNGAGKTTTIECIEGLRRPDKGSIRVMDIDVLRQQKFLQEKIGVQLQATSLYDHIRIREALELFSSLYKKRVDWGKNWAKLVEPLGLADKINDYYQSLSGGQKQRLHIALALVHDPEIIFLDELTTGLDPQARRAMWDLLLSIQNQGKTIFLTTHYMEEAEHLCDRVAIFDKGKIIALDSPSGLIARLGGENRILFSINGTTSESDFSNLPYVSRVERVDGKFVLYSSQSSKALMELIKRAEAKSWPIEGLHVQRANLEDVFLSLTGREIRE
jgi:ABC-2 type transport system ATP-binding protein